MGVSHNHCNSLFYKCICRYRNNNTRLTKGWSYNKDLPLRLWWSVFFGFGLQK